MNALNRRRYMGNKGLPYDAEIEYLESTGKQYIDTGILAKLTNSYKIDCEVVNLDNNRKIICGSYIGPGDKSLAVEFGGTSNQKPGILRGWVQQGNVSVNLWTAQALLLNTNINVYWEWDPNTKKLKIEASDGQTSINNTSDILNVTLSSATSQTFWLFKDHRTSSTNVIEYPLRIKHLKLYENDILVRDFIPVRKDTTGYMYDKVSGTLFGNKGSGDFILGDDIIPIEYLKQTGTQWIDTNYYPDSSITDMTLDIEFYGTWNNGSGSIVCAHNSSDPWLAYGFNFPGSGNNNTNTIFAWTGYTNSHGATIKNVSGINKNRGEFKYSNGIFSYGGKTLNTEVVAGRRANSLRIFSSVGNETAVFKAFTANLYGMIIKENNEVIHNYVPVRINQIGYLYDKVSNRLFGNSGTGDFVLGPDKN